MKGFREIDPKELQENVFSLIGSDWMLITAGNCEKQNTMTASWGGLCYVWNYPMAYVVIRPQRYTFEFTEREDRMTLSFFEEKWRKALAYCGSHSGREEDKFAAAGISVQFTETGTPAIAEARLVLECCKVYVDMLKAEGFLDKEIVEKWYPASDYHRVYILKIEHVFVKED